MKPLTPEQLNQPLTQPHQILKPRTVTNIPGVKGSLPMRPGEVILTDGEKKKLAAFGWKEGDPLPGNIAMLVSKAQKEVEDDIRTAKPFKDKPIFKAPEPVDISTLSKEKQNELSKYLQQFKEMAPQIEAAARSQEHMATLPPNIQKAIRDASGVEVVDSRQSENPAADLQRRINEAEGRVASTQEKELADEVEEKPVFSDSETGLNSAHDKCPRCNWTVSAKMRLPSRDDALLYVAAMLGDRRFEKEYSLYGGKLTVRFRQLSSSLSDRIFHQVAHEIRKGEVTDDGYTQLMRYRMILCLSTISIGSQEPLNIADAIDAHLEDEENRKREFPDTYNKYDALPVFVSSLQKIAPLNNLSVWRACRETFTEFNDILDELDSRADNPDFWKAIGV
jgi:hypothetical protein